MHIPFKEVYKDPSSIAKVEIRTYVAKELPGQPVIEYTATTRESFFMGPAGGVMFRTVWEDNRLLTIIVKGGK